MKIELKGTGDDLTFIAKGNSGHWLVMDSAKQLQGNDGASRPMELILQGLAGCTGMDVLSILHKKRIVLTNLEIEIEAERALEHPKVFTKIDILYKFWGNNLTESAVQRAIELSETKYCSVSAMLRSTAIITSSFLINP
ncbi:MAG TPA: OsmC family peroxiredoxin [Candidatus Marinimicrobia bacterium]|nr:OsmC family peroxiredoxin [Candidatus Neomarinimicrobiota bacterium]